MTDKDKEELASFVERKGCWWLRCFCWPRLLRCIAAELKASIRRADEATEAFRLESGRTALLEKLGQESRADIRETIEKFQREQSEHLALRTESNALRLDIAKSIETIRCIQSELASEKLESERAKAELAKTQAQLERAELHSETQKLKLDEMKKQAAATYEWIKETHRLSAPMQNTPIRKLLSTLTSKRNSVIAFMLLLPTLLLAQFPVNTPYGQAWSQTNVLSLANSNSTSKPLTNRHINGVTTLFGIEQGSNVVVFLNGSNIVINSAAAGGGSGGLTTNANQFLGVPLSIKSGAFLTNMNFWGDGTNNGILWLDGNLMPLVDNVYTLGASGNAWSSATVKSGGIQFMETGGGAQFASIRAPTAIGVSYNMSLPDAQGGNGQVITNDGTGTLGWWTPVTSSGLTTNANQFLGVPLSIKSGAQMTNVTFWESNALLPALIATNQPGGTIDLVTMLTTNGAGLRVTSNGAVVVRGVIGSTTNYFEVRNSNNITPIFAVTHSNTVRIVTPNSGAAEAGGIIFDSEQGFTQTPVHFFVGGAKSGSWRADSSGNQVISGNGVGDLFFCTDGGSGEVHFQQATVGTLWSLFPSASVAAWHGGTVRRGQITNVWDIWGRTNLWLTRTGLLNGLVVTQDIRFLGHNSTSNHVWVCTNATTGEGEWRPYGMAQLADVADTLNVGVLHGDLLSFDGNMELWTNNTPNQSQFTVSTFPLTLRDGLTVTNPNSIGILHVTNKPGVDRAVRFWNTNGLGYSEFGVVTQAWVPTNKFLFSVTNPVVGEVLEIQSVSYADGVASIVITNAPDNSGGGGGLTTNANQFGASVELTIKTGAFLTNMNYWGTGTNNGDFYSQNHFPLADNIYSQGSVTLAWLGAYVREDGVNFMETAGGADGVTLLAPASLASGYVLTLPNAQGSDGQVITNNGSGVLGWWTPGGPLGFNQNQLASNGNLVSIKSGALLTNTLFYPSNLTGPAIIATATTAQVTNLVEWRGTNDTVPISISSNANAIVYGRLDMSNAVAFRTNNIDFRLPVYQAFTNALQTNLVLQLTNVYEGVTHRIDAYGAGRLGNGRTNAWQLLCTVPANHFIYWPPGTTNGSFDVLVNSNQIVSFTFMGGLGSTNVLAAYRVLEGIGAN